MSETSTSGATGVWSYRTGAWFGVFGPEVTVLLPESERDRVVGLWSLVDGGASFDEVLDGLLASGLSRLPGFALVSTDHGPTRVLLRGAGVRATLQAGDDEVVLDGGAGATWVERSVEGVTNLTVSVEAEQPAEEPDQPVDLPILTGLVRVSRIDHPPYVVPVASPETLDGQEHAAPPTLEAGLEEGTPGVPVMEATPGPVDAPAMADLPEGSGSGATDAPVDAPVDAPGAPDVAEEPVLADAPADGAEREEPAAGEEPVAAADEQPDDEQQATVAMDLDALGADAAVAEDAADRLAEEQVAPAEPTVDSGPVFPPGGDPLFDPMPPQPPDPSAWEPPWGATPSAPPPGPPPSTPPVPAAPAASPYAPPDAPPPPADAPAPPPLPVGSWEPIGGFPPPPPADPDHDGLTQAGGGSVEPDTRPPSGIPGQPPAPAVTAPVAKLLISDGQEVVVDRVVLIGRAPEARRFSSTEQPKLVTVPSRMHEISSTHVEVRPGTGADHGSAVVTDMGSTNGTVLVQPGLGPEDLKPGIAVQLIPGAIINLGDGITIQVTRP